MDFWSVENPVIRKSLRSKSDNPRAARMLCIYSTVETYCAYIDAIHAEVLSQRLWRINKTRTIVIIAVWLSSSTSTAVNICSQGATFIVQTRQVLPPNVDDRLQANANSQANANDVGGSTIQYDTNLRKRMHAKLRGIRRYRQRSKRDNNGDEMVTTCCHIGRPTAVVNPRRRSKRVSYHLCCGRDGFNTNRSRVAKTNQTQFLSDLSSKCTPVIRVVWRPNVSGRHQGGDKKTQKSTKEQQ